MKNRLLIHTHLLLACLVLGPGASWGTDRETVDLASLEALTGRWISLRAELAAEQQSWTRQEQQWQRELGLLEQEISARQQALDADASYLDDFEEVQARMLAEREHTEAALRELGVLLEKHELSLRAFEPLVPASLAGELGTGFRALPANDTAAARAGVLRRLQTVLALYTQIESLQNNLHVVRELIMVNGQQREADVLYVGLARGFAVSARDDWAAIGTATQAGWRWNPAPAEAAAIRAALRTIQREGEVELVPLLWEIMQEVQP